MLDELTSEEQAAVAKYMAAKEAKLDSLVMERMRDRDSVVAAFSASFREDESTREYIADLLMGCGDTINTITAIKLSCMDILRKRAKEAA